MLRVVVLVSGVGIHRVAILVGEDESAGGWGGDTWGCGTSG